MRALTEDRLLLAHRCLIRARNGLWLTALLWPSGIALALVWPPFQAIASWPGLLAYALTLGFLGMAGNGIGSFGLKYPLAAVAGSTALSGFLAPFASPIAPVAVFFWLKHEMGVAYRGLTAGQPTAIGSLARGES